MGWLTAGTQEFDKSSFQSWVEMNCPDIEPDDISTEAFNALDKDHDGYITFVGWKSTQFALKAMQ